MSVNSIPTYQSTASALDAAFLKTEGLRHVQALAGKLWTDFNAHDPGVTILELVSFAITDLAYRTRFSIPDLLAANPENHNLPPADSLFPCRDILPGAPLTVSDYRRLLIDLPGVRNAWVTPHKLSYHFHPATHGLQFEADDTSTRVRINGIWDAAIDFDPALIGPEDTAARAEVLNQVRNRLQQNRNLGDDFGHIETIKTQEWIICAEIELDWDADLDSVQAAIFWQLQAYLTPSVPQYTLSDMLAKGKSITEIYDGPFLEHGFMDDADLAAAELKTRIQVSDLIRVIMAVPHVLAVKTLTVVPRVQLPQEPGEDPDAARITTRWVVPIQAGAIPIMVPEQSRIVFYRDQFPGQADPANVSALLTEYAAQAKAEESAHSPEEPILPAGRDRNIQTYQSFQNLFPAAYGIGPDGLSDAVSTTRKAQARQLKAYLLFMDQLLANYLAQLAHVRHLFSIDAAERRTIFTQPVTSAAGISDLYKQADMAPVLAGLVETEPEFLARRNQFLDHLTARFAESFTQYAVSMYAADNPLVRARKTVELKAGFLADYPVISQRRGMGYDAGNQAEIWDTDNVSGFERRLCRLLGISNHKRRNLANIQYDVYLEKNKKGHQVYRWRVRDQDGPDPTRIILSSSMHYAAPEEAVREMRRAMSFGSDSAYYQRLVAEDGRFYYNLVDPTGEVIARRIKYFKTDANREAEIQYLSRMIVNRYSDEGLFVIEHLLLRPRRDTDPFLPIPSPLYSDLPAGFCDPYSAMIHILLPAWVPRFQALAVRQFAEAIIRRETPAHLLPRICWIDLQQMSDFEKAYHHWLAVRESKTVKPLDQSAALSALILVLNGLRNVYPEATLSQDPDAKRMFVLDQTILGTLGKEV